MKKCNYCNEEKQINEFAKCGTSRDKLQSKCKKCSSLLGKKWRETNSKYNKEYYINNANHIRDNQIKRYRTKKTNEPWYIAYCIIKQRAKEKNIEFDLDIEYIKSIWTDICPVLGIPLKCAIFESGLTRKTSKARPLDNSPTIDRIDPAKGYIKGNICIMSYRANMIKNCGTLEEHEKIVAFLQNIKSKEL